MASKSPVGFLPQPSASKDSSSPPRALNFSIEKIMEPDKKTVKKSDSNIGQMLNVPMTPNLSNSSQLESAFKKYVPSVLRSQELLQQYPFMYYHPSQLMCVAATSVSVYSVSPETVVANSVPAGLSAVNSAASSHASTLPENYIKPCHMKRTIGPGIDTKGALRNGREGVHQGDKTNGFIARGISMQASTAMGFATIVLRA
ncbi:hypothetical protein RN001_015603 [Aquatica leii]|uniref:Uncharacterized protein n=1 Tax=Aquatica leii TaxID=1421715 RepID=A0AAN7NX22_9COLE|nr:hypothetical protein RN001_015603 [Aquatica leii]